MLEAPMAYESEEWNLCLPWPNAVLPRIIWCIQQDPNVIIPEFLIYHRAQIQELRRAASPTTTPGLERGLAARRHLPCVRSLSLPLSKVGRSRGSLF
jgi:hypothetical protein